MRPKSPELSTELLFAGIWDKLISKRISKLMDEFSLSISKSIGFEVKAHIYEGIGLNGYKSIYCNYEGKSGDFRLYMEITTDVIQRLDLFIADFNIPLEMRGKGLGTGIYHDLLSVVGGFGIRSITLNPVGKRAKNFWLRLGFKSIKGKKTMGFALNNNKKRPAPGRPTYSKLVTIQHL